MLRSQNVCPFHPPAQTLGTMCVCVRAEYVCTGCSYHGNKHLQAAGMKEPPLFTTHLPLLMTSITLVAEDMFTAALCMHTHHRLQLRILAHELAGNAY